MKILIKSPLSMVKIIPLLAKIMHNSLFGIDMYSYILFQNVKQEINKRIYVEIDGGHDILADNYEDIFRVITLFARK